MEKLELKVGDYVRLVGPGWVDYDDDAVGKIVRVDEVGTNGVAYSNTYGSLTVADGIPYTKDSYYVEKVEDETKKATVTLTEGGAINIVTDDRRLTVKKDARLDAWYLSINTQSRSIDMVLYQNEMDDLRAFLEYWSTHGD